MPNESPEERAQRALLEADRCRTLLTIAEDFHNFNLDEVYSNVNDTTTL